MNEQDDKYAELKACLGIAAMMPSDPRTKQMLDEARQAIEELQAATEQCEPVATVEVWNKGGSGEFVTAEGIKKLPHGTKLYINPPKATGEGVPDSLVQAIKIQCSHGNWNYNHYMHGMANGMIFAKSCMDNTDPVYLSAPDRWVADYKDTQQSLKDSPE